jgi:hypothetical protein
MLFQDEAKGLDFFKRKGMMNYFKGRQFFLTATACAVLFISSGCSTVRRNRDIVPEHLVELAKIPGIPQARTWGDVHPKNLATWLNLPSEEIENSFAGIIGKEQSFLAISGGGANGAYGAGIIAGWSKTGKRPEFTMVSGVSTGSIIAPFAFLGPEYDEVLHDIYTQRSTAEILIRYNVLKGIRSDAFSDTSPLRKLLAHAIGQEEIDKIAREHRKGRRLYIGTVNMDCLRPVSWNIGAIANSGVPGSRELILSIITASSSIPVVFPPVFIDVEAGGEIYQEMHVDGGLSSQVFIYPPSVKWDEIEERLSPKGQTQVYVIRNAKLEPEWAPVEARVMPMGMRSISALIRAQGLGDLRLIYRMCERDGLGFNFTYIPRDFNEEKNEQFDPSYMKVLFDMAHERIQADEAWEANIF